MDLQAMTGRAWVRYLIAAGAPLAATAVGLAIGSSRTTAAALVYILCVLAVASTGGLGPGVLASGLSFLGLNFFFTPPRRALSVAKTDDLIALVVFVSVGMVVSTLLARGLAQRERAERREHETRSLYAISTRLLSGDVDEACADLARVVRELFGLARCEVWTFAANDKPELRAADGDAPEATGIAIPLSTGAADLGSLVLVPGTRGLGEAERRVATVFAQQIASGLERAALEAEAREARMSAEGERVRRALFSAVGHDFRTPLASIKAAITALLSDRDPLPPASARELLRTAQEETERLERQVSNLLDLTRIRSGAISPERAAVAVDDLIDDTLAALRQQLSTHRVSVLVRADVPKLFVDAVQAGQALRNLLENAAKYAPARSEIRITASEWHGDVEVRVIDQGPGVERGERAKIFEEFYRGGDGRVPGTGLGLAIARALVRANDGEIAIEDTPGGGATFVMRLPAELGPLGRLGPEAAP